MRFRKREEAPIERERTRGQLEQYRYHAVRNNVSRRHDRGSAPTAQKKTGTNRYERLFTAILCSVILGSLLYVFWLDVAVRIRPVKANDPSTALLRPIDEYEQGAKDILDNSLWSRTKVTLNTDKFAEEFTKRFPEVATVTMTIPLSGHKPVLSLVAKEPKLLIESNGITYIVDQSGVAIAKLTEVTQDVQSQLSALPRVNDKTGIAPENGQQMLTEESVTFLLQAVHQYEAKQLTISNITLPADKPNEVWITHKGSPYYTKYIVSRSAREQVGAFLAVQEKLTEENKVPSEYIDVRVADKAFYK